MTAQNATAATPGGTGHAPDASSLPEHATPHSSRRKMVGRVISAKMKKTVVVEVVNHSRDPLYGKYVRSRSRYKAHDETNQYKAGDQVEIEEHRPLSRDKRFIVIRLIKKFVEE